MNNRNFLKEFDEDFLERLNIALEGKNNSILELCEFNLSGRQSNSIMMQLIVLVRLIQSANSSIKLYFYKTEHYLFNHRIILDALEFELLNGINVDIFYTYKSFSSSNYKEIDSYNNFYRLPNFKLHNVNTVIKSITNINKNDSPFFITGNCIVINIDDKIYGILDNEWGRNILVEMNNYYGIEKNEHIRKIFDRLQ